MLPLDQHTDKAFSKPNIRICDEDIWLTEFLERTEASIINMGRSVSANEAEYLIQILDNLSPDEWFELIRSPFSFAYFNQKHIAN